MRFTPCLPALLSFLFSLPLTAKTIELFNGRDLQGWHPVLATEEAPLGEVFSVTAEGHLRIAGMPKGYLRTEENYANYRLVVEWRWVGKPSNSGVLLHTQGVDKVWPLCIEAQLKSSRAGDIIFMGVGSGGTSGEVSALVVDPDHPYHALKRHAKSSENAPGEWNRYEILAQGSDLELRVNGVLQNQASALTLSSGAICLQSEGAPIEFRKITLVELD